jgi:hypothetical protein
MMMASNWLVDHALALWSALLDRDFAAAFGSPLSVGTLSCCLVLWTVVAGARLRIGAGQLDRALRSARATLNTTPAQASRFASDYERIAAQFDAHSIIGPSWRDWRATLITPATAAGPVRSTIRPADYVSLELLRECRINPRLHAAMPGLLVGVGLLLTFVGLSLALGSAGDIVGAPDAVVRNSKLQALLDTASAKFVFSLVGLACSIAYTTWRTGCLQRTDKALDALLAALEERIPLATAAGMQAEANAFLQQSLEAQLLFTNQLAVSLGSRVDEALDTRLGEHIGPLREAIESLSASLGTHNQDAMKEMLKHFVQQLHGGTDGAMKEAATTLAGLASAMEEVRTGLGEAASRMATAADQMAVQMGRQADEAMGRIAAQMEGLVGQLRELAEQSRNAGGEALQHAAAQIGAAGEGFTAVARGLATSLDKAIADMAGRMGSDVASATSQMAAELAGATQALRSLVESSRNAGDDAVRALADRLGAAADAFTASSAEVARTLAGGAGDAAGRLTVAMVEMKDQFARLADEMGVALRQAGGEVVENSRSGAESLANAANAAAEALRAGGRDGGEALRDGGANAGQSLNAAARTLAKLQSEADGLAASVAALQDSAAATTAPLARAAADLAQAGGNAQATTSSLADLGRRMTPVAEAMAGAATRLETVEKQVAELSARLTASVERFGGMETALAGIFTQLQRGLTGFAEQVTRFVQGTNNDMAKAVTTLDSNMKELTGAVEELAEVAKKWPRKG